ncbi:MAG: hypothetical protein ACE5HS_22535 [bacterium]
MMIATTIGLGLLLFLVGLAAYFVSGTKSITALIPAFFGLPISLLGVAALQEKWQRHAMHGAVVLALLGFLGSVSGLPKLFTLIAGGDVSRPLAVVVQSIMAIACAVLVALGIRSFIEVRRQRKKLESNQ